MTQYEISGCMKSLFVSGTDTEVGKTWISCQILRELHGRRRRVGAWKPVCSGAVERDGRLVWDDVDSLTAAIGGDLSDRTLVDRVCPQRFVAPLAPNIAARLEDSSVVDGVLERGLRDWEGHADYVLVEGAGGLLSPTSDRMLVADLVIQLDCPLLLVAANRLGVIHQTLATVEAARARNLHVPAVILNQVDRELDPVLSESNAQELRRLLPDVELLQVSHDGSLCGESPDADCEQWFV